MMANALNFTLVLTPQPDGKWGSLKEDGETWSGMMGSLVEAKADMALSGLRITQERKDAVDFVDAAHQILITLMAHDSSKKRALVLTRYFEAFTLPAWIGIVLASAVLAIAVHASFRLKLAADRRGDHGDVSLSRSLVLVVYQVFFQRDYSPVDQSAETSGASRLSYFVVCLFSFTVFASYSALLTATMIGSDAEIGMESMEELALSDLHLFLWEDSSTYMSLQLAPPGSPRQAVYRAKVEGKLDSVFIGSNEEIHRKLAANPRSVFIDWDIILAGYPDMYSVRSFRDFTPAQISIGLQKGSEFREALNHQLRKMDQSGIR